MTIRVGIDTGGTFTDLVALNQDTGEIQISKRPSTPGQPARAVLEATGQPRWGVPGRDQ